MPMDSVICRRKLDEERGNPQICECPICSEQGRRFEETENESILDGKIPSSPEDIGEAFKGQGWKGLQLRGGDRGKVRLGTACCSASWRTF